MQVRNEIHKLEIERKRLENMEQVKKRLAASKDNLDNYKQYINY